MHLTLTFTEVQSFGWAEKGKQDWHTHS